jgi:2-oxoglutarate dehydrogenase E2 component (dihydrolipoamide succinyltransferase)
MSIAVKLPALGESVVEGTVSRWLVEPGERVEVDQSICEVTTDKVDVEIPAPASGTVARILVPEGATVDVGAELAMLELEEAAPVADCSDSDPALAEASSPQPELQAPAPIDPDEQLRATPVARRLADEARLDLSQIDGSGPSGRITKSDVLTHSRRSAVAAPPAAAAEPGGVVAKPTPPLSQLRLELEEGDRVLPMSPQRRLIAAHMVYSKHTSPHVGTVAEIDFGGVAALRGDHASAFRERHGASLTYLPFVAYAVAGALREYPALNASVAEDAIVERAGIHLSLAVETEQGLMAPVIRRADSLSLAGLAIAVEDLSLRARSKQLGPDELRGGTFTISNPGRRGNLYGFAIINQPQVGILRMGELVKRPVARTVDGADAIVIRPMMHIALSYDHRAVDGARANAFLHSVRERLESAHFDL